MLDGEYSNHRLAPGSDIPSLPGDTSFSSIIQTNEETTIVCPTATGLQSERTETNWSVLKVIGPLDFSLTGILAGISGVLSDADISIFAVSTWDTDYILIRSNDRENAIQVLTSAGHFFERTDLAGENRG